MAEYSEKEIDAKYRKLFGRVAGYLPANRESVDTWHRSLKKQLAEARSKGEQKPHPPSVEALAKLIELNGVVRMYVEEMINQVPKQYKSIENTADLLDALTQIVTTAPVYSADPNQQNFFPMSTLFTYMMMTKAGEAAFRNTELNGALANVLKEWCNFLDSEPSLYVVNESDSGWLCQSAFWYNKLYEFVFDKAKPHWGWKSFNDYFHREIRPECRPIDRPDDPKVIVSANDGKVYNIASNVQPTDKFWLKGQPYSLVNMLNNQYVERFIGGSVFQSFLSGADYHRWRAPIAGTVRYTQVVNGLMFSDAESAGFDPTAATYSQGYEAAVNTRGLVFIESDDPLIGMVCVIPIGITEISSVTIVVKSGDRVTKGKELGYFSYGGSSMALVFQPGAIDYFTVANRPSSVNADDGPPIRVNAQIAVARAR
jgi:phosphatidylserine decarboxylase